MDRAAHREAVRAFADAAGRGDLIALMKVLDPDIVWHADGGGVVRAAARPILGADKVARMILGLMGKYWDPAGLVEFAEVNGEPGLALFQPDGTPGGILGFTVADGLITAAYVVANPAKLRHVSPPPAV